MWSSTTSWVNRIFTQKGTNVGTGPKIGQIFTLPVRKKYLRQTHIISFALSPDIFSDFRKQSFNTLSKTKLSEIERLCGREANKSKREKYRVPKISKNVQSKRTENVSVRTPMDANYLPCVFDVVYTKNQQYVCVWGQKIDKIRKIRSISNQEMNDVMLLPDITEVIIGCNWR